MLPIMLSEEKGVIRLSVRATGDDEIVDIDEITPIDLTDDEYQQFIQALLAQPQ
jgi:hypothetical protein